MFWLDYICSVHQPGRYWLICSGEVDCSPVFCLLLLESLSSEPADFPRIICKISTDSLELSTEKLCLSTKYEHDSRERIRCSYWLDSHWVSLLVIQLPVWAH